MATFQETARCPSCLTVGKLRYEYGCYHCDTCNQRWRDDTLGHWMKAFEQGCAYQLKEVALWMANTARCGCGPGSFVAPCDACNLRRSFKEAFGLDPREVKAVTQMGIEQLQLLVIKQQ